MTAAALIIVLLGYAVLSYGWVLLKGWNISWKSWISPLKPYVWPPATPPPVPQGQVFP